MKQCKTKRDRVRVIDPKVFRHDQQELFWNVVHYFINHQLPYDLFLPYKQTEEIDKIDKEFEQMNSHNVIQYDGKVSNPTTPQIRISQDGRSTRADTRVDGTGVENADHTPDGTQIHSAAGGDDIFAFGP